MADPPLDLADLQPDYLDRLARWRNFLGQRGIDTTIISGYRSPEYQQELINRGVRPAAAPWRSFHNYGFAADVQPKNPADYPAMWSSAPQFGLKALGSYDPNHFQMAGSLDDLIGQYHLAGWRPGGAPQGGATAVASNDPRAQHIAFIRDYANKIGLNPDLALGIAGAEGLNAWSSSNPNAGSYVDRDASGKPFSFGDFQLNVRGGMGVDALKAGIDPRDPNQWQAADRFALDRMKAGGVGPWSDPVARAYAKSGQVKPFVAGNTLNTTGGPSVGSQTGMPLQGLRMDAQGGSSIPGAWGTSQPKQALAGFQAGSPAEKSMLAAGKTLGLDQGDQGGGDQGPQAPPAPPLQPAQLFGGQMAMQPGGSGINNLGRIAAAAEMQRQGWNMQPMPAGMTPGTPINRSPPPGAATGLPAAGLPGTTLNSPSALQMALLYGMLPDYGGMSTGGASPSGSY